MRVWWHARAPTSYVKDCGPRASTVLAAMLRRKRSDDSAYFLDSHVKANKLIVTDRRPALGQMGSQEEVGQETDHNAAWGSRHTGNGFMAVPVCQWVRCGGAHLYPGLPRFVPSVCFHPWQHRILVPWPCAVLGGHGRASTMKTSCWSLAFLLSSS